MEKEKFKINSKIDFYTDIVSTNANDRPLIYISNEAIELKYNNDKLKEEKEVLKERINKAIEHIEKVKDMYTVNEVVNQVGMPILDISIEIWKKELLDILKGVNKE